MLSQLPQVTVGGETFTPSQQSGVNSSSGAELDVTHRSAKKTQIGVGYAYVESDSGAASIINGVRLLTRENHQLAYSPRHQIAANIRQDLPGFGPFKSTYLLGNGRWVSAATHRTVVRL